VTEPRQQPNFAYVTNVGRFVFASRAEGPASGRTRIRVSAADPACRIGGDEQSGAPILIAGPF
jgi:hypothetical protein